MKKPAHKKSNIIRNLIILIFINTICFLLFVTLFPIFNTQNQFEFIKNEYNTNPVFSSNRRYPIKGGWNVVSEGSLNSQLVLTQFDIINPIYTVIIDNPATEYFGNIAYQEVSTIYLKRTGIDSFKIIKELRSRINNLSFNEAVDLVSKYDITTDFPGKENYDIINYPPLTQEEIDTNREMVEEDKNTKEAVEREKQIMESGTPEQKLEVINSEIARVEELIEERGEYSGTADLKAYVAMLKEQKEENEALLSQ